MLALAVFSLGYSVTTDTGRKLSETTFAAIAGYAPGSDVVQHNRIDLDQAAMETALGTYDWTTATTHYATGGNSQGSSGARTIQGFSTSAQSKMYDGCPGCPYHHYSMFYDYYGDFDYADKWVSAALAGTDMTFTSGNMGPNLPLVKVMSVPASAADTHLSA